MLGKIHFFLGITIVVIFLFTGQYMHHKYNHLQDVDSMNRALFRAGHLYILLFGLTHVSLGINFKKYTTKLFINLQKVGSIIMFLASFLVIFAFFIELPTVEINRPLTFYSLILILVGVSTHGLLFLFHKK